MKPEDVNFGEAFKGDTSMLTSIINRSKSNLNAPAPIMGNSYEAAPIQEHETPSFHAGNQHTPSDDPVRMSGGSGKGTQSYEGWRDQVYTDTTGNATIGFGHKLTKDDIASGRYANGISKAEGEALYQRDMNKHKNELYKREPWIANLSASRQEAMTDLGYNMGSTFLDKFPTMKSNLQAGNWEAASGNLRNSLYARQVGQRAKDNANRFMS